ncbi:type II and III secretion system protein family protein [Thalassospira alkalitolerans]|uniref:type II and III secretion system protein family protein n=1 Tax=Thalassospira alkalitolerans TaxID=1293890 RepID=UPI003AA85A55
MFRTICLFILWMIFALPAVAQTLIETRSRDIDLFAGQGKLIRLDAPAETVFLANPDVADVEIKSPKLLYIYGKQIGETTLFVIDDQEEVTLSSAVEVSVNMKALGSAAHATVPNGTFSVSEAGGAIILSGRVGTITDAERIESVVRQLAGDTVTVVNSLALETPPQVNLQVRIAEVSRSVSEDLGVNWTTSSGSISNDGGLKTAFSISGTIEALKSRGLVTILSEPNLTARSGDKASFLAGGRFPFQTVSEGDDSSSVQFESFGVELEFLPEVLRSDQIKLNVRTQIRELDFSNGSTSNTQNIPLILERSASTTIEVGSGQSFAIAGLFSATTQQDLNEVPGLSDIPILGALFRSSSYQSGETELVIIVTPYIVAPAAPDKFKTPLDGFTPAGTLDRQFLGSFSFGVPTSKNGPVSVKNINGNAGFLLQ